jgi:hypothetical protein
MSTVELLKNVEALPARERKKFVRAVLALSEKANGVPSATRGKPRQVKWPDIEARAKRIFGNRRLPSFVLLERAERAF